VHSTLRQVPEPSGSYVQPHLRRGYSESIAVPQQPLRISADTARPLAKIENLERALSNHQLQEHDQEIRINALVKENEVSQKSYRLAKEEARQLKSFLRDLSDLVTKTDEATEGRQNSLALHSVRMDDAYHTDELLLSVQEDWSGRGSHAEFKRGETIPLEMGRLLGHGNSGEVVEATCKGVKVALKKIRCRDRIQIGQMRREIDVLKELKHRHVVKLVGSYTQQLCLGLLLWPVARCDLAFVLEFMEMEGLYVHSSDQESGFLEKLAEHDLDMEGLRDIAGIQNERIWSSFGCLTRAMAYLHENNVRHKDIKPSNILLSRDGIWITDFGSAKDFTADLTSTSESRERGTLRYCAPEVSSYEKSGRSADIFSLGCVFLEMLIVLSLNHTLEDIDKLRPLKNRSYEANLNYRDKWLALVVLTDTKTQHLLNEIKQMLNHDRAMRPTAKELALRISIIDEYSDNQPERWLHGSCCNLQRELEVYKARIEKLEGEQRESQK
jgi:serine/threonine protein kinase